MKSPLVLTRPITKNIIRHKMHKTTGIDELNSHVLITGGAGFIGSNIAHYLITHTKCHVTVIDNLSEGRRKNILSLEENERFTFIEGDISEYDQIHDAMKGVDYVLHQAALGSVPRSFEYPLSTHRANATGFITTLEAARNQSVKRIVYASSSSVYGDSKNLPKTESIIGNPLSPYAITKRSNEMYANVYAQTHKLEIIGLRYFNIFGPRQNPNGAYAAVIPLFISAIMEGKELHVHGDGEQTRDFTHVHNAVMANLLAMTTDNPAALGQIFNVAAGARFSLNEMIQILKEHCEKDAVVQYGDERMGDIRDSHADISKAMKMLGYKVLKTFPKGLQETYDWYLNNK